MPAQSHLTVAEALPPLARPQNLPGRDLLSAHDLNRRETQYLIDLALRLKAHPAEFREALGGRTLAMLFEKPSLRTRLTFEVGMNQLDGRSVFLGPEEVGLGRREAIKDVARNLCRWVDVIMARVFAQQDVVELQ